MIYVTILACFLMLNILCLSASKRPSFSYYLNLFFVIFNICALMYYILLLR